MILELYGGPRDGEQLKNPGHKTPEAIVFPARPRSRRKPIAVYDLKLAGKFAIPWSNYLVYRRWQSRGRRILFQFDPAANGVITARPETT